MVGLVVLAFFAGSIMTGAIANAQSDGLVACQAGKILTGILLDDGEVNGIICDVAEIGSTTTTSLFSIPGGEFGWNPGTNINHITAGASEIATNSMIVISRDGATTGGCHVTDVTPGESFLLLCERLSAPTTILNVAITNP